MGSSDHVSSSQSFIDLLYNQQDLNHQTLSPQTETDSPRETRHRWSLPEEKVLVSVWLNTSKDSVIGNEQKGGTFWNRVAAYYAASPSVANLPIRESNHCKQKWSKINKSVSKFAGCYDYASREHRSGETEDDVLELAYKLYYQDQRVKFNLEHAWRLLKNDQKWCSLVSLKTNQNSKRSKGAEGLACNTSTQVEDEPIVRPMGVKAAKAKGKKRVKADESDGSSVKEFEQMWAIKEKDMAIKERISKQKILDSLILKEKLTDNEIILKDKLIFDMFS